MIITLPPFSQRGTNAVRRIKLMIELANIFQKFAKEIEFSNKISKVILLCITDTEEENAVWKIVKKKRASIEEALNGMPATVLAGKKRIRLNKENQERGEKTYVLYNGSGKKNSNTSLYKTVC